MALMLDSNRNVVYCRGNVMFSDTHGNLNGSATAAAALHREEICNLINEIVDQKLTAFIDNLSRDLETEINSKIDAVIQGIYKGQQYNIKTVASLSVDSIGEIFKGTSFRKLVTDAICEEVRKALSR